MMLSAFRHINSLSPKYSKILKKNKKYIYIKIYIQNISLPKEEFAYHKRIMYIYKTTIIR